MFIPYYFFLFFLHYRRNMDYFYSNLHNAVGQTEPENSGGEITVRLPSETMPLVEGTEFSFVSDNFFLSRCMKIRKLHNKDVCNCYDGSFSYVIWATLVVLIENIQWSFCVVFILLKFLSWFFLHSFNFSSILLRKICQSY